MKCQSKSILKIVTKGRLLLKYPVVHKVVFSFYLYETFIEVYPVVSNVIVSLNKSITKVYSIKH